MRCNVQRVKGDKRNIALGVTAVPARALYSLSDTGLKFIPGLLAVIIFLLAPCANAATYYVDSIVGANCTGGSYSIANRDCNGSDGNSFTTIQAAVKAATSAGDTVAVRAGTYDERVTTAASGAAGNLITIHPYSAETVILNSSTNTGFTVKHSYVKVDGFVITGRCTDFEGFISIDTGGNFCQILNNYISGSVDDTMYGIRFKSSSITNCLIHGNVLDHIYYPCLNIDGVGHQIIGNTLQNLWHDAMRVFGHDHLIKGNSFFNMFNDGRTHVDLFQTFTPGGSYNIRVEGNFAVNCQAQIGNFKALTGEAALIHDWIFLNNVFYGVTSSANIYGLNFQWIGNTFYETTTELGHPLAFKVDTDRAGNNGVVKNNLFIGCGVNQTNLGWYSKDPAITGLDADYNYVAAGPAQGFSAKQNFSEIHGKNGGDPRFNNVTMNDFRLLPASPAVDAGVTTEVLTVDKDGVSRPQGPAPDIGAYELDASLPLQAPTNVRIAE